MTSEFWWPVELPFNWSLRAHQLYRHEGSLRSAALLTPEKGTGEGWHTWSTVPLPKTLLDSRLGKYFFNTLFPCENTSVFTEMASSQWGSLWQFIILQLLSLCLLATAFVFPSKFLIGLITKKNNNTIRLKMNNTKYPVSIMIATKNLVLIVVSNYWAPTKVPRIAIVTLLY